MLQSGIEERLAVELARRKREHGVRALTQLKTIRESEELRNFKELINQSYVNKERAAQIAERQTRKLIEVIEDGERDEYMQKSLMHQQEAENQRRRDKIEKLKEQKVTIQRQMQEKVQLQEEDRKIFEQDKENVQKVVDQVRMEDLQKREVDNKRRQELYDMMVKSMEAKTQKLKEDKAREMREQQEYLDYMKKVDKREYQVKEHKSNIDAAKQVIYEQMKAAQLKRQADLDELENIKEELYREEIEAKARQRDAERVERQLQQKEFLRTAELAGRQARAERERQEMEEEQRFTREMMKRLAYEDKIEQMNLQRRRMKELEHKKAVEKMWAEKLRIFREEKAKERDIDQANRYDSKMRDDLVQQEKERLLKEHLPYIDGFMPRALVQNVAQGPTGNLLSTSMQMNKSRRSDMSVPPAVAKSYNGGEQMYGANDGWDSLSRPPPVPLAQIIAKKNKASSNIFSVPLTK